MKNILRNAALAVAASAALIGCSKEPAFRYPSVMADGVVHDGNSKRRVMRLDVYEPIDVTVKLYKGGKIIQTREDRIYTYRDVWMDISHDFGDTASVWDCNMLPNADRIVYDFGNVAWPIAVNLTSENMEGYERDCETYQRAIFPNGCCPH